MMVKLRHLLDQDFNQSPIISLPDATIYQMLAEALQNNLQGDSGQLEEVLTIFGIQLPNSMPLNQIYHALKKSCHSLSKTQTATTI